MGIPTFLPHNLSFTLDCSSSSCRTVTMANQYDYMIL